jgi:peptidoglycan/LPS O-acetylase OafA/YrhL
LRAVAILLVVCAHAKVPGLQGGFVGVDVFFVLSGYLITALLLHEFETRDRIDFVRFYARRAQRLFPALALVVLCTSLAAMALLAPLEQPAQATAATAAITWSSNFLFAVQQLDYFGPSADSNLFLHTWSLGVEEQFYLLWPAWMVFLLGAWTWQGRNRNARHLAAGMFATCLVCGLGSIFLTYRAPELGFYMVFSRGWQFALGALCFLLPRNRPPGRPEYTLGWLGLFAIVAAAMMVRTDVPYPGYWAILPSLGTGLVLASGRAGRGSGGVGTLLSLRPLQWLGGTSYAWYLWHWPVLLLGASLVPAASHWHLVGFALISLMIAALSRHSIENPLRRSLQLKAHPWWVLGGTALLAGGIVAANSLWTAKAEEWSQQPAQRHYGVVRGDQPAIYTLGCDDWHHSATVHPCVFGDPDAPHTVLLMGDSIAGQWFPAFATHFGEHDWRLVVITKSACPMVDQPVFNAATRREYAECAQWRNDALAGLGSWRADLVVIGSSGSYDFSAGDWTEGTARILARIAPVAQEIAVLVPTPVLPFDGPECLARRDWRRRWIGMEDACVAHRSRGEFPAVKNALAAAVALEPRARLIDLGSAVCPAGTCRAERAGMAVYRDGRHMTNTYAATLSEALGTALDRGWKTSESDNLRH